MKTNAASSVKSLHLGASIVLLFYAFMLLEAGRASAFFFVAGIGALIVCLSRNTFLSRPRVDALVLWLEAVCLGIATFKSFSDGKLILPWLFAVFAVFYSYRGYRQSGLK